MNGADYVATERLTTKKGDVLAEIGERCDQVPASSLDWLAEQGLIVLKPLPQFTDEQE
jgi:hypothetical protein